MSLVSDLSTITYMMDKTNGGGGGGGKSNKSLYYNRPTVTLFYTYMCAFGKITKLII